MAIFNSYLNFPGTTEQAFNFYKSIFGGEFAVVQRYKDTPHGDAMSAEHKEMIMHISLPLGNNNVLMGTDDIGNMGPLVIGNNFSMSVTPDSKDEADKIFNGLSANGNVIVPMADMFWGAYFGMVTDQFGIKWMVNYEHQK